VTVISCNKIRLFGTNAQIDVGGAKGGSKEFNEGGRPSGGISSKWEVGKVLG